MIAKGKHRLNREGAVGLFMASIPLIGFVIFGLLPMVLAVVMSFMNVNGYKLTGGSFAGIENYKVVLTDSAFYQSIGNTLYMAVSMVISLVLALIVAYLITRDIKGKKAFRTVFFVPYVCSVVATTLMWKYMFNTNYGIINEMLGRTGENAIDWLGNKTTFIPAVIVMSVWSGTGFGIILFSAALTNINSAYVEAAKIDGAGAISIFFKIVLPALTPTIFYLFATGLIGALQAFSVTNVLATDGGPGNSGVTMVFYLYRRIFDYLRLMGQAAAASIVTAAIIGVVTAINFIGSKLWVNYD